MNYNLSNKKHEFKNVFICGGTGFLGYYSAKLFLKQGAKVGVLALPNEVTLNQSWWPKEIECKFGYLFNFRKMNRDLSAEEKSQLLTYEQKVEMFKGYDTMVYAVGPDDRVHTPAGASAYEYFHEKLVDEVVTTFKAAREAGVKKAVLLNSYFAYFNRIWPQSKLAERHPYIKVRTEQADALIKVGGGVDNGGMDVVSLELPYIFGNMPQREPLWKEVFLDRFAKMPAVLFPKGGTSMIDVQGIAEGVVGAAYYAEHGMKLPIGKEDRTFKEMINPMMEAIGSTKRFMGVPTWMATLGGYSVRSGLKKINSDSGLDYRYLMTDIQSKELYNEEECRKVMEYLHYDELGFTGGGSIDEALFKTMLACYPHRFDENNKLIEKWRGVNPIAKETATNNKFYNKEHKK